MPKILDADPTVIQKTEGRYEYGSKYEKDGKKYVFCYYHVGDGTVTAVKGELAYLCVTGTESVPKWSVTADHDSATKVTTTYNAGIGAFCSAPGTTGYGVWIQYAGPSDNAVLTDQSVDVGDSIVGVNTEGAIAGIAGGASHTGRVLGVSMGADASTTAIAAGLIHWMVPLGD
jgi:hypothetical protein